MGILTDYVEQNLLSKANVLRYIDDYSLYCHYIGVELELYTKYSSPLRIGDDDPSFSIYYSKYLTEQIWFKDQSTGKYGDVFTFLQELMGNGTKASLRTVLLQINSDHSLGLNGEDVGDFKPKLIKSRPLKRDPVEIQVTSYPKETEEFKAYWLALDIPNEVQEMYYAKDVQVIHYISDEHITIVVKTLTISYEIVGHYKVYQPFAERMYKFRNNYLMGFVEGALQLQYEKSFCIISKSTKECMFYRAHWNWDAVAGTSENAMISPYFMNEVLKKRYKQVFIWLDPDEAGQVAQQRYLDEYPWLEPVVIGSQIEEKDPTDYYAAEKLKGKQAEAKLYLENLITEKLT